MTTEIEVKVTSFTPEVAARAQFVKERITQIKGQLEDNFFDLCDLLLEVQEKDYARNWGYDFGAWVEEQSGLDMSARQAYYLANIAKKARTLGLSRGDLKGTKISKLKEIFTLNPEQHGEQMKQLVAGAIQGDSLETIKNKVQEVRAQDGMEPFTYLNLRIPRSVKDETVDPAFELVRRMYGNTRDAETGELMDINDAKCIELICVAYLQDPNNYPENQGKE